MIYEDCWWLSNWIDEFALRGGNSHYIREKHEKLGCKVAGRRSAKPHTCAAGRVKTRTR